MRELESQTDGCFLGNRNGPGRGSQRDLAWVETKGRQNFSEVVAVVQT